MNKTILVFLVLLPLTAFAYDSKSTLTVKMEGFSSDNGYVNLALFKTEDGFPEDKQKACKNAKGNIKSGKSEVVFTDIPYGEYAISIYHDENANGKLDKNFMGVPKEGHGASNNPKSFGPPKFEEAKFKLDSEKGDISISIKY